MTENSTKKHVNRAARRILLLLILVLFAAPLGYSALCREMSRWKLAAGFERYLQQDLPGAINCLDSAIRWSPDWTELHSQRAHYYMARGDAALALPDCDRALELARSDWAESQTPKAYSKLAHILNQRAYAYVLHGEELEQALENIDEAITIAGENYSYLDTRGYIHLSLGNDEEAAKDIELAVQLAELNYKTLRNAYIKQRREAVDRRPADRGLKDIRDTFAVLYHHRGELNQRLDRTDEAQRDLETRSAAGLQSRTRNLVAHPRELADHRRKVHVAGFSMPST